MNTQPEALRLAEQLETEWGDDCELEAAAAELRRLHEANQALLEALEDAEELIGMEPFEHTAQEAADAHKNIRAAIAKHGGEA